MAHLSFAHKAHGDAYVMVMMFVMDGNGGERSHHRSVRLKGRARVRGPPLVMPRRPLYNAALKDLPAEVRDRFFALSIARSYARHLVARAIVQVRWKEVWTSFVDDYIALMGRRWARFKERKNWANSLSKRKILQLPQLTAEEDLLPAATRSDRRRELLQATRLRLFSGQEITVKYKTGASLHDFYVNVRGILNVPRGVSMALLRPGLGALDERLLSCSRDKDAHCVRGRVFEVEMHP